MTTVRASSLEEARQRGAEVLEIPVQSVEAEPIAHDPWRDLS